MNTNTCKMVPVGLIDLPRAQLRQVDVDSPEFMELAESIGERGLDNSILVRPKGDRYELVDGLHRLTTYKQLRHKEIPAIVKEMSDEQALIAQLTNAFSIPPTQLEYARHILRLQKANPEVSLPQLANSIKKSVTWLKQQLLLLEMHPNAQLMGERGQIKLSNLYVLATLPRHMQPDYIQAAVDMSVAEFREYVAGLVNNLRINAKDRKALSRLIQRDFKPHRFWRSLSQLNKELKTRRAAANLLAEVQPETLLEAFRLGLDWATNVDPISLKLRKQDFETSQINRVDNQKPEN